MPPSGHPELEVGGVEEGCEGELQRGAVVGGWQRGGGQGEEQGGGGGGEVQDQGEEEHSLHHITLLLFHFTTVVSHINHMSQLSMHYRLLEP